jgi:hypothetical protein
MSTASRDVQRVVRALTSAAELPLEGDVYAFVPDEGDAVRSLAHARRIPRRSLWLWYWATDQELTLVALTNVSPESVT